MDVSIEREKWEINVFYEAITICYVVAWTFLDCSRANMLIDDDVHVFIVDMLLTMLYTEVHMNIPEMFIWKTNSMTC